MLKVFLCLAFLLTQARTCLHAQAAENVDSTPLVIYATEFKAPNEYRKWYREVEKCARAKGDFERIMWTVVEKPWSKNGYTTYGSWLPLDTLHMTTTKAVILLNSGDWRNEFYVKHEMLHDVLGRNGMQPFTPLDPLVHDSVNIRRRHPAPPYEKCAPTYIWQMREMEKAKLSPWKEVYVP